MITDEELSQAVEDWALGHARIFGSVSSLVSALIAWPVPAPWWIPTWILSGVVLCTASGFGIAYMYEREMDLLNE